MKRSQSGFAIFELILIFVALGLICGVSYFVFTNKKPKVTPQNVSKTTESDTAPATSDHVSRSCPDPLLQLPVDINKVTSVLYPGQTRGGQYKPHGGFRLDDSSNSVEVRAPMDAKLVAGSRYIEQGEQQILLDFQSDCGVNFRFDHLLTVSSAIQNEVNKLPAAKADDSRTTNFDNQLSVKTGDTIATAVGFEKTKNVSFDFGVYDTRQPNSASNDSKYKSSHPDLDNNQQLKYAVCWLDLFADSENKIIKSLPASDPNSGKNSDYCK